MNQESKWYIIGVKAKSEDLVLSRITSIAKKKLGQAKYDTYFKEFFIPKTSSMTVKNGQKVEVQNVMYPGYIFAKMNSASEAESALKGIDGFKGFLKNSDKQPKSITQAEYDSMVASMSNITVQNNKKSFFMVGDVVKVKSGSFIDFEGKVVSVDKDASKLSVNVQVFGRDMSLDLGFSDVEKVEK